MKDGQTPNTTSSEQTPEAKPEAKPEEKPAEGAPEAYGDFTAPEGYTLAKEVIDAATPIFKELNLSQADAQKLVDFHTKAMIDSAKAPMEAYDTLRKSWRDTVLADTNLASGGKLKPEVSSAISKLIDSVGDADTAKDFRELMNISGVGDHPAFVRTMFKWAQSVTEGTHVTGKGPSPNGQTPPGAKPASQASALYPNLP